MLEISKLDNGCRIIGEVDIANSKEFEEAILDYVDQGIPVIRLDLSNMEYIDSTGLGVLMNIRRNLLGEGQEIILVQPKRSIQKLMQLTGVDQIFTIEN